MIEIAMTNGKISIRSFAEAHGLGEFAATTRLQRAVKKGEMVRERNGRNVTYYFKNNNRIKAHDPFNLAGKKQCNFCQKFFSQFSCGMLSFGECDCPKCQGYCKC